MAWMNCSPRLEDVLFDGNSAGLGGGGAYFYQSSSTIESALFSGNSADRGAALLADGGSAPEISGSTFAMNQSSPGQYAIEIAAASPDIWDTIIANTVGGAGVGCTGLGIPVFTYCCSYGNAGGDSLCGNHVGEPVRRPAVL